MKINISHINRDKGYIYSQYDERIDRQDRRGLFRLLSREFGRCVSNVHVGQCTPIGWVFEKKERYSDTGETYIMETWVSLTEERNVSLDELEAA